MRYLKFIVLTVTLIAASAPAKADYFVWEDPDSGLTMSFPDTWARINNQEPDTVLTVKAPSLSDEAICRIRTRPDARYLIFPPRYSAAVQKDAYSTDFWKNYLNGQYDDVQIHKVQDQSGLGRGFASFSLSSFITPGEVSSLKTGIAFATLYYDTAYILECSALAGAFENWLGLFQSIAGSMDFRKAHHELATGHFEDFIR